jgi:hypothetical protein
VAGADVERWETCLIQSDGMDHALRTALSASENGAHLPAII